MQVSVEYHREDGSWWGHVTTKDWGGVFSTGDTLPEVRKEMRELLPFAIDERLTARSIMFLHCYPNPLVKIDPEASETFELFLDDESEGQ